MTTLAIDRVSLAALAWPVPPEVRSHLTDLATWEPACPDSFALCVRLTAQAAHEFVFGPTPDEEARCALWDDFQRRIDGGWSSEDVLEWLTLLVAECHGPEATHASLQLARLTTVEEVAR